MLTGKIGIGQGLIVTIFSMALVILILLAISYLIRVLKILSNKNSKTREKNSIVKDVSISSTNHIISVSEKESELANDEEIVAAISAAIAVQEGVKVSDIKIRNIRRIGQSTPIWGRMGRQEQLFNKL